VAAASMRRCGGGGARRRGRPHGALTRADRRTRGAYGAAAAGEQAGQPAS
jgi:hypothetical protein